MKNDKKNFYFLQVKGNMIIDSEKYGNLSRYVNHSCDNNCVAKKYEYDQQSKIGIYAKKYISKGDELTINYNYKIYDDGRTNIRSIQCLCGSKNCCKFLGSI